MNSIDRSKTRRRGLRMAMQVAALSSAAVAGMMALASSDAQATESAAADGAKHDVGPVDSLRVNGLSGFSCFGGPVSRGPAAPPVPSSDFDDLVAELLEAAA